MPEEIENDDQITENLTFGDIAENCLQSLIRTGYYNHEAGAKEIVQHSIAIAKEFAEQIQKYE